MLVGYALSTYHYRYMNDRFAKAVDFLPHA